MLKHTVVALEQQVDRIGPPHSCFYTAFTYYTLNTLKGYSFFKHLNACLYYHYYRWRRVAENGGDFLLHLLTKLHRRVQNENCSYGSAVSDAAAVAAGFGL